MAVDCNGDGRRSIPPDSTAPFVVGDVDVEQEEDDDDEDEDDDDEIAAEDGGDTDSGLMTAAAHDGAVNRQASMSFIGDRQ